jgi:hypothetical protein
LVSHGRPKNLLEADLSNPWLSSYGTLGSA